MENYKKKINVKVLFQTVEKELLNKFDITGFIQYAFSPHPPPSLLATDRLLINSLLVSFSVALDKLLHIDKFGNMYFTSFQCNRILFRWYTIKEWQRSFFMRQLQKVKVVKVKVEGWENLLNFQIDCEETTTNVKNCAGSSRIWLSLPPPCRPSPPHLLSIIIFSFFAKFQNHATVC